MNHTALIMPTFLWVWTLEAEANANQWDADDSNSVHASRRAKIAINMMLQSIMISIGNMNLENFKYNEFIIDDARWIENKTNVAQLKRKPLYNSKSETLSNIKIVGGILSADDDFQVWADWYDAVLKGGPRYHDAAFARAINDLDLWKREPAEINAQIKRWLEEERAKFGLREIGASDTRATERATEKKPRQSSRAGNSATEPGGAKAKRGRPSQPKSEIGRSVAKNRDGIIAYCDDTVILIDRRIEELKKSIPNEPAAKEAWDQEIARLDELKAKAEDLKQAVPDFAEGKISEAVVVAKTNTFAEGIKNWWNKRHVEVCDKAADKAILLVAGTCAVLAGGTIGWLVGAPATGMIVIGSIVGGKSIISAANKAMKKAGKSIEDGAG